MAQEVPLPCGHKISIEGTLKMRELRAWAAAEDRGDWLACYGYLTRFVKAWDWEGLDPSQPESYDELEMMEYKEINQAISDYIRGEAARKN